MAALLPPVCILCAHTLARLENRRKLHSPASKHIFPLLSGLVEEMYPHAVETIIHPKSFVCRPCLRGLEKLRTLREDVEKKEEVRMQVKHAGEAYGLQALAASGINLGRSPTSRGSTSRGTPPPSPERRSDGTPSRTAIHSSEVSMRKRTAVDFSESTPSKRQQIDTPTRRAIHQIQHTGTSPAVAVSLLSVLL